jgi:hypothetical protein
MGYHSTITLSVACDSIDDIFHSSPVSKPFKERTYHRKMQKTKL